MDPLAGIQGGLAGSLKKLQGDSLPGPLGGAKPGPGSVQDANFGNLLGEGIQDVVDLQRDSTAKTQGLITGETKDINEVLIANEKAGVAFEMMLEVRNKLMAAWKEITRLQV